MQWQKFQATVANFIKLRVLWIGVGCAPVLCCCSACWSGVVGEGQSRRAGSADMHERAGGRTGGRCNKKTKRSRSQVCMHSAHQWHYYLFYWSLRPMQLSLGRCDDQTLVHQNRCWCWQKMLGTESHINHSRHIASRNNALMRLMFFKQGTIL